jgi:peptidyl-prolyl cis-trans isomerase B (cyclophilin B)
MKTSGLTVLVVFVSAMLSGGCGGDASDSGSNPALYRGVPKKAPESNTESGKKDEAATKPFDGPNPIVLFETSKGNIKMELFPDKAPITVKNFLQYVDDKHYDGLTFHRVISTFMIQGGGFDVSQKQRETRQQIKNESGNGVPNNRGYVAMARTNDLHSATSQFYINVVDNPFLDQNRYCAFGKVIEGMDVVDTIKQVKTGPKGMFDKDCPLEDVLIKSAKRADK